jgi:hypothetical protein
MQKQFESFGEQAKDFAETYVKQFDPHRLPH